MVFHVLEAIAPVPMPVRITLCAAIVKFDRFEWMIEKATELGVERILPVEATRTERGLFEASRKRSERWARIARESSQQSRRVQIPEILPAVRLEECLRETGEHRYFLDEEAAPPLVREIPAERSDTVVLLIGPEGGWTEAERASAVGAGWCPVSLGPLVLRAETAAAAAIAVVINTWMA